MKLTDKVECGLLFTWYLTRAGKATIKDAAYNMEVYEPTLSSSAKALVKANLLALCSPNTYELVGNPTVKQVIEAFGSTSTMEVKRYLSYKLMSTECRTLAYFSKMLDSALDSYLSKTMRSVGNDFIIAEVNLMESANKEVSN